MSRMAPLAQLKSADVWDDALLSDIYTQTARSRLYCVQTTHLVQIDQGQEARLLRDKRLGNSIRTRRMRLSAPRCKLSCQVIARTGK